MRQNVAQKIGLGLMLLFLTGCGVVERSQQCESLAEAMRKNESNLAPSLPADPSSDILHDRANSLSKFADDLKHVYLKVPELIQFRRDITEQLSAISQSLELAAEAVTEKTDAERDAALVEEAQSKTRDEEPVDVEQATSEQDTGRAKRKSKPTSSLHAKQRQASRKYLRAQAEVDAARTKTEELLRKLQQVCH